MKTCQVEVITVLETIEQPDDPLCTVGIPNQSSAFEHVPLSAHMSLLALAQHVRLPQLLHRIQLASPLLPHERNDAKRAMPDRLELDKRAHIDARAPLAQVLRLVLPPALAHDCALPLAHPELIHLALHREPALLARGLLAQEREVQVFEVDPGGDGLFEGRERGRNRPCAGGLHGSRAARGPGVE